MSISISKKEFEEAKKNILPGTEYQIREGRTQSFITFTAGYTAVYAGKGKMRYRKQEFSILDMIG